MCSPAAVPQLAPSPWPAVAHLSQSSAVRETYITTHYTQSYNKLLYILHSHSPIYDI